MHACVQQAKKNPSLNGWHAGRVGNNLEQSVMDFKDQYKHPLWQKKRLETLSAHGFSCQRCGSEDESLHVHHKVYVKGRKIWEYSIDELVAVCESCHKSEHEEKDILNEILLRSDTTPLDCAALLFGFVGGFVHPDDEIASGLEHYNPGLFYIGEFARNHLYFHANDIKTILCLNPDSFHDLAESVRLKNGKS